MCKVFSPDCTQQPTLVVDRSNVVVYLNYVVDNEFVDVSVGLFVFWTRKLDEFPR